MPYNSDNMRKTLILVILFCLLTVFLSSSLRVRLILAWPLVLTEDNARGDACYVLAGGDALWERLAAASDLYHMRRVPRIILMRNDEPWSYSFVARSSWTQTQWALDFLSWRGVPRSNIEVIPTATGMFGTLQEARNVAAALPRDVKRLVLVSSAPHMRRCVLAFGRVLPDGVDVVPYTASSFKMSQEMYNPLWLEYLKLGMYALIAG